MEVHTKIVYVETRSMGAKPNNIACMKVWDLLVLKFQEGSNDHETTRTYSKISVSWQRVEQQSEEAVTPTNESYGVWMRLGEL